MAIKLNQGERRGGSRGQGQRAVTLDWQGYVKDLARRLMLVGGERVAKVGDPDALKRTRSAGGARGAAILDR